MEVEIEGKTVEEAIQEGLKKLNCSREDVDIKILNEGSSGLFGLMGTKPACVRLSCKNTKTCTADIPATQAKAKEILETLFKLMNFRFSDINVAYLTGRIFVNVKSEDSRFMIGKNGSNLYALEHILNLMLHKDENTRAKVDLDIDGYKKQHEDRLQSLAAKAAEEVRKTGTVYRFQPMPVSERRFVHFFLKRYSDVEAVSEGNGGSRKILLRPKK